MGVYLPNHACRGLARRRQAPPLAPTPGAHRAPGLPALSSSRTSSHARFSVRAPFSLQTPVERSERVAGCWAVRARANLLSLGVWHFTLRFVLPWSRVGYPGPQRPKGEAGECSHHLDPKSTQMLLWCWRAFIQSEEVRPTRCRVAPTQANPRDELGSFTNSILPLPTHLKPNCAQHKLLSALTRFSVRFQPGW